MMVLTLMPLILLKRLAKPIETVEDPLACERTTALSGQRGQKKEQTKHNIV